MKIFQKIVLYPLKFGNVKRLLRRLPLNSSSHGRRNVTPFQSCQTGSKNSLLLQKCTCEIFIWNRPDFCMKSEEWSAKSSVTNAQESPNEYAIYGGKFGNIEMLLRSFVRKVANSATDRAVFSRSRAGKSGIRPGPQGIEPMGEIGQKFDILA